MYPAGLCGKDSNLSLLRRAVLPFTLHREVAHEKSNMARRAPQSQP